MNQFTGTEFFGKVVHKRNKDDADNPFVNMDLGSVSNVPPENVEVAGATPAQSATPAGGLNLGGAQS